MADLTQPTAEKSLSKGQIAFVEAIERGEKPNEIAKRVHPTDKKRRLALRQKLWRMLRHDANLQRAIVERGQANLLLGVVPATIGLANRGARKTDAAKLVLEATGVHTPRSKTEHSGEVKIWLNIPRPEFDRVGDSEDPPLVEDPAE